MHLREVKRPFRSLSSVSENWRTSWTESNDDMLMHRRICANQNGASRS